MEIWRKTNGRGNSKSNGPEVTAPVAFQRIVRSLVWLV